ncbi:UDP-N-acetylglucosamine transferase subunit ALG14 [Kwoniella heveanensis CBS 569]|nr:UDP-N-acetylglucosamine transferase subunit ALG14 [Kwoniella heveanensis CBS 569]
MRTLLSTLPFERYTPRTYVYCHGDEMSLKAIALLESEKGTLTSTSSYTLLPLPRARKVGESLPSTLISATRTLFVALYRLFLLPFFQHPTRPFADVLLVNGPGTCVVLVLVSYIRRILGLRYTKIIYVESFARVKSLSLSGKLVEPFVDRLIVQWPNAGTGATSQDGGSDLAGGKVECRGWLV